MDGDRNFPTLLPLSVRSDLLRLSPPEQGSLI
jgi:hypothetical protein